MSADAQTPAELRRAPWLNWPETQAVFAALQTDGHNARAVGGAVRNTLLGRAVQDVDFATDADPERVMDLAGRAGLTAVPTGLDHGTVTLVVGDRPFEVTTLRTDVETYGRRAKVAFTADWEADARRRDFTVNALYADAAGRLYDPLGGLADVEARRVRFIGDPRDRIREDFLRILRFFRFIAELEAHEIDEDGLRACVRERAGLGRLAPERVRVELVRLLAAPAVERALRLMFDHGLLALVLGAVPHLGRLTRLIALEEAFDRSPDAILRLAALTVMVTEDAERIAARFRLSNDERVRLTAAARYREISTRTGRQAARAWLYYAGAAAYRDAVLIAWAASGAAPDAGAWRRLLRLPETDAPPEFPLRGRDILALGVGGGPGVGEILKAVEKDWIAGGFVADREALLGWARALAASKIDGPDREAGRQGGKDEAERTREPRSS